MGLFSDVSISGAKISGGRAMPLLPGTYTLEVTEVRGGRTRQKHPYFEVIFKVVESTNDKQPVGSTCNQYCQFEGTKYPELAASQALELAVTLSGLDPRSGADAAAIAKQKWEDVIDNAVATPKLFLGRKVNVTAVEGQNKQGKTVTYRNYSPVKSEKK